MKDKEYFIYKEDYNERHKRLCYWVATEDNKHYAGPFYSLRAAEHTLNQYNKSKSLTI